MDINALTKMLPATWQPYAVAAVALVGSVSVFLKAVRPLLHKLPPGPFRDRVERADAFLDKFAINSDRLDKRE